MSSSLKTFCSSPLLGEIKPKRWLLWLVLQNQVPFSFSPMPTPKAQLNKHEKLPYRFCTFPAPGSFLSETDSWFSLNIHFHKSLIWIPIISWIPSYFITFSSPFSISSDLSLPWTIAIKQGLWRQKRILHFTVYPHPAVPSIVSCRKYALKKKIFVIAKDAYVGLSKY